MCYKMKLLLFACVFCAVIASILSIPVNKSGDTDHSNYIDREMVYASADPNGYVTRTFTFPSVNYLQFLSVHSKLKS